jgi:hypothetical protein
MNEGAEMVDAGAREGEVQNLMLYMTEKSVDGTARCLGLIKL